MDKHRYTARITIILFSNCWPIQHPYTLTLPREHQHFPQTFFILFSFPSAKPSVLSFAPITFAPTTIPLPQLPFNYHSLITLPNPNPNPSQSYIIPIQSNPLPCRALPPMTGPTAIVIVPSRRFSIFLKLVFRVLNVGGK